MTRRPLFWVTFSALGVGGAIVAVLLFSVALPSISVDIRMDRGAAIDSAAALSARYSWGAPDDRSAATFGLADDMVQTFIELEGGGRQVIERLAERNVYEAYQWRVRRFREGRVEESLVRLTPAGEPYGFELRLAEDDPGDGNQSADEARSTAEATAVEWGVDLTSYDLSESSSQTLPGGRVDHTFVYRRTDEQIGDARFRLRVVVSGSHASELTHVVQVPEAFSRRYADMRSTNDTIALVAQAILLLVFVLLGAGVGSALLLRKRWLVWRAPLAWGAAVAVLLGGSAVNQLPLTWGAYDTALSATSFVLQQLAGGVAIALLGTPLIAFFLLAGESLGRRAFPDHVQQWRFWSPEVASSSTALGMTVAAYLLVGLQVGYVVLFYLGTQRLEGWWSPAEALVQPDLLATYLPWLEAVSLAFFASLWEESVFRAVPIACAALLGARFGRRGLWIWGAVVVQALVFAAGHANYPQQPPYARVIELTGPALLWGVVYVRFGLVPTVLAHFLYDLALISIVLFESDALLDQAVIVAVGLVPLGVVVGARLRHGGRAEPPDWAYNRAWTPKERAESDAAREVGGSEARLPETGSARVPSSRALGAAAAGRAGAVGLPGWVIWGAVGVGVVALSTAAASRGTPTPLWGDRSRAIASATSELEARGVAVDRWDVFVTTTSGATEGREYVFQEAGPEVFADLEGSYFGVPRWLVRLVDWDADPEERVEEYRVWVGPDGEVTRVGHTLPEARAGATLGVEDARALALEAIGERFGLGPGELREVEAEETSRPNRIDWLFTFTEVGRLADVEGEVRLQVRIAGAEVADVAPMIRVPEEWERARRRVESRSSIMSNGLALLILIGFGAATVTAVVVWSRRGLPKRVMWKLTATACLALLASSVNDWPSTAAVFSTNQPWGFQVGATVLALALLICMAAPAIGLVGSLAHAWLAEVRPPSVPARAAPAIGLAFGGLTLLASAVVPRPENGSVVGAASAVPMLAAPLSSTSVFLVLTSGLLLVASLRVRFRHHAFIQGTLWSLLMAVSVVLIPTELQESAFLWAAGALVIALMIGAVLHACWTWPVLVPGIVATTLAVQSLWRSWMDPYAGARMGGVITAFVLGAIAWAWTRELSGGTPRPSSDAQSLVETRTSVGSE